ncbi:hypothetical protein [Bacillus sp. CGMCC 1.16541]|uniref:hypothetical protein n=1 Tax=Bacillus sp. CGMCC 1.16541 TaxID=2185143 RepID=UPI001EF679D7|nr:hypothetical protein [Bacillus sp. CGMCC 1.16541]
MKKVMIVCVFVIACIFAPYEQYEGHAAPATKVGVVASHLKIYQRHIGNMPM